MGVSKAANSTRKKSELRFPLHVGLCYEDDGRIVLDLDDEVRGTVQLVFRLFQETGSAYAVVKRFAEDRLRFPKRTYGVGPAKPPPPLWEKDMANFVTVENSQKLK